MDKMSFIMAIEAKGEYLPGVTNGLAPYLISPRSSDIPQVQQGRKSFHLNVDLQRHLGALELSIVNDPITRYDVQTSINDINSWLNGLARLGVSDFDVKTPEEMNQRVAAFKLHGPLERIVPQYRDLPLVPVPEPSGFIRIRQDVAAFIPSALALLLVATNYHFVDESIQRTDTDLQGKCETLLPEIKSNHADEYAKFVATIDGEDPDSRLMQVCTETVKRDYQNIEDLGYIIQDREHMFRIGFGLVAWVAGLGTLISGGSMIKRLVEGVNPRRRKTISQSNAS